MRLNKLAKKIFAAGLAVSLMMANAGVSFAADTIAKENKITFTHELTVKDGATTPDVEYSYTITPATGEDLNTKPEGAVDVSSGIDADKIKKTTAKYTSTDNAGTISKEVTFDLSEITFPNPGIYRYVVTEVANPTEWKGLSKDEDTRYLDVYVYWNEGETAFTYTTVLYKKGADDKDGTFKTEYSTQNLKLTKTVTGNQGSHTKQFSFAVEFANLTPNTAITLTDGTKLNANSEGKATTTVQLAHSQSVDFNGLPVGATYSIVEQEATDYKTTVTGADDTSKDKTGSGSIVKDADSNVNFENNKNGDIPTGVILDSAPFILIIGLAAAALIFTAARKKVR